MGNEQSSESDYVISILAVLTHINPEILMIVYNDINNKN